MIIENTIVGAVRRILTTSAVDGPGNRVVVFLQGCQLNCLYCHNPETIPMPVQKESKEIALQLLKDSQFNGYMWVSAEALIELIKPYRSFVSGVTISGGECTIQSIFLMEVLKGLKENGFQVLIDTNGQILKEEFIALNAFVDGWIFDAKSLNADEYKQLTGIDFETNEWWHNLSLAASQGKLYEVRTVIVPVYLNNYRNVYLMSEWLKEHSPHTRYKLIRFRNQGVVGALSTHPTASDSQMIGLKRLAKQMGISHVIVV